jgi:hypothetical protein
VKEQSLMPDAAATLLFSEKQLHALHGYLSTEMIGLIAAGQIFHLASLESHSNCGPRCPELIKKWSDFFGERFGALRLPQGIVKTPADSGISNAPVAMLSVSGTLDDYLASLEPTSRQMIRKAMRAGYTVGPFLTRDYLSDMYAINTSMPERGGQPMTEGYLVFPEPADEEPSDFCPLHRTVNIGVFLDGRLVAYAHMSAIGEMGFPSRFIGHGGHLPKGIMNLLFYGVVDHLQREFPAVRAFHYLTIQDSREGLAKFKLRVGFRPSVVIFRSSGLGVREMTKRKTPAISISKTLRKKLSAHTDKLTQLRKLPRATVENSRAAIARLQANVLYKRPKTLIARSGKLIASDSRIAQVRPSNGVAVQTPLLGQHDFLSQIARKEPFAHQVVLGASIAKELPPTLVSALAILSEELCQSSEPVVSGKDEKLAPSERTERGATLASWISNVVQEKADPSQIVPPGELAYFIASTGYRTVGVLALMERYGIRLDSVIVDHGSCCGLMPWLVAADYCHAPKQIVMIEPLTRYRNATANLWTSAGNCGPEHESVEGISEEYSYSEPPNVVIFSHTLFRIPRGARQAVLDRAWEALRPGGILLINETTVDAGDPTSSGPDLPRLDQLISAMRWTEEPEIFRPESRWKSAESVRAVSSSKLGSASFIVAHKQPIDDHHAKDAVVVEYATEGTLA